MACRSSMSASAGSRSIVSSLSEHAEVGEGLSAVVDAGELDGGDAEGGRRRQVLLEVVEEDDLLARPIEAPQQLLVDLGRWLAQAHGRGVDDVVEDVGGELAAPVDCLPYVVREQGRRAPIMHLADELHHLRVELLTPLD